MFSWEYNEKILKDWIYNHAEDYGRLCAQIFMDSPLVYKNFLQGFGNELEKRRKENYDNKT